MKHEELKKLSNDHWDYVENVNRAILKVVDISSVTNEEFIEIVKFHYISAFEHGYKHGIEFMEENK